MSAPFALHPVVVVVQARMSSRRFPGKMLAHLAGRPLIQHVLDRASCAKSVDQTIVATSEDPSDDALAHYVEQLGFPVYRGSLSDVLTRVHGAAVACQAQTIVRITGDCPLLDYEILDAMLARFASVPCDCLVNVSPPSFPDGLDIEICTRSALDCAAQEATTCFDREHVTPFILSHRQRFQVRNYLRPAGDASHHLWSVDQAEDIPRLSALLEAAGDHRATSATLIALCQQHPHLAVVRTERRRNEGILMDLHTRLETARPRPIISQSNAWWERGQKLIPAGTQTLSKGPGQYCKGFGPKYLVRGQGCHVWDADGNQFIDYPMGLGPVTLGHGHPAVVEAVSRAVAEGSAFSLMHPREVELAERIHALVPCAEQIRFGKNGSDATAACIRAARALTSRDHIARHGYHGWQDWAIDRDYGIRAKGVPQAVTDLTHAFPYNDLAALEKVLSAYPCAAVIMEPVNLHAPAPGYLEGVRELAHRYGALLIFDEVITGFRYSLGGAQQYFGVTPDLCAMGKGVANGLPLSVVCGQRHAMRAFEEVFFSFTFGGETVALSAALATLAVMETEDYSAHVWRQGAKLQEGFNQLAATYDLAQVANCAGLPPWTITVFHNAHGWSDLQLRTLFQQEMLRHGVLFSGSQFLSLAHDDAAITQTIQAYEAAFQVLREAIDSQAVDAMTLGQINEVIFRRG